MNDNQTLNIIIGILFFVVIGVIRRSLGPGWG
jgi:hypothetical protein